MEILQTLRSARRPLSDRDLAAALGADERLVTRECRRLAFAGSLIREQNGSGTIVNRLDNSPGDGGSASRWSSGLSVAPAPSGG